MPIVNRKVEYRLYPTPAQGLKLHDMLGAHQRLYNAALEQRKLAWRMQRKSVSFNEQCKDLTALRADDETYAAINAQSSQVTLKRFDRAYQNFFRRVKAGQTPGFPRFKSYGRYPGWGYSSQSGWKYLPNETGKNGHLKLSGVGFIQMRGRARNEGTPSTCEIMHKNGRWYASITLECQPIRVPGKDSVGIDWGLTKFATIVSSNGDVTEIENPRHLKRELKHLKRLQRDLSRKKLGSNNRKKAKKRVSNLHRKVANQRKDFLHQESAKLVSHVALIATETLNVKSMTANGGNHKKGLNRAILDASPGAFFALLRYKAEEAGVEWVEVPTKQVKPSQRCSQCGVLPEVKKTLADREHRCDCGLVCGRDENAAKVMLNWAIIGREPSKWGGNPLGIPLNHETSSIR